MKDCFAALEQLVEGNSPAVEPLVGDETDLVAAVVAAVVQLAVLGE